MKLSKYVGVVKKDNRCTVYTLENGDIWLGTRSAFYKAEELPEMSGREQIRTVLDIEKKKMEKIFLTEERHSDECDVHGLNLCDWCPGEVTAERMPIAAVKDGVNMTCLKCKDGELIFYDEGYLAPLSDILKEGYLNTCVRSMEDGERYIAVKDGFVLVAVILPLKVINDKYLDALHDFLIMCSEQNDRQKIREKMKKEAEKSADQQISMEGTNEDNKGTSD